MATACPESEHHYSISMVQMLLPCPGSMRASSAGYASAYLKGAVL